MSTTTQNRVFVTLRLPLPVPQLVKVAQAIIVAQTSNPHVPSPSPPLATLATALDALVSAEAATKTRKAAARTKAPFAAKPGAVSGTVILVARAAAPRASYEWEWSGDGGKTWTAALPTLQARTAISGLPAATTVQFRFRAVTRAGAGDWSLPTSLLVK